jgi:catechol 2,3-dioxygenase-like lactoylglutathione lyase family enzyme
MPIQLDHMILPVAELEPSIEFFTSILGCTYEGVRDPFSVIRVTPGLVLLLSPWGTEGGVHLAFALPRAEFDATFDRIKGAGIPYGDSYHAVGNMQGPRAEDGARGPGEAVYCFDPNRHLIEIRYYGD